MSAAFAVDEACPYTVEECPLTREEWLISRRSGLGGSDAACIVGVDDRYTPNDIYLDKIDQSMPEDITNDRLMLGNCLEDGIIRAYETKFERLVVRPKGVMLRSKKHPFLLANVDGFVLPSTHSTGTGTKFERGVDAKNTSMYEDYGPSGSNIYPIRHFFQGLHYMCVTGLQAWDFAVVLGGRELRCYTVEYDEEKANLYMECAEEFWQDNVMAGRPPMIDLQHPKALEDLKRRFPNVDSTPITLSADTAEIIRQMEEHSKAAKTAKDAKEEYQARILARMGNAGLAEVEGTPIRIKRTRVAFTEEKPRTVDYVRMTVSRIKQK